MILSPGALIHPATIKAALDKLPSQDDEVISFINRASSVVEKYCRRHFRRMDRVVILDGSGLPYLRIADRPIHSVAHLYVDPLRAFGVDTEILSTAFTYDEERIYYATDYSERTVKLAMNSGFDLISYSQAADPNVAVPGSVLEGEIWYNGTKYQRWTTGAWVDYIAFPLSDNIELGMIEYFQFATRRVKSGEIGIVTKDWGGTSATTTFETAMPKHVQDIFAEEIFYG